jgi:tetratricopeptide (TPR) repeat protein
MEPVPQNNGFLANVHLTEAMECPRSLRGMKRALEWQWRASIVVVLWLLVFFPVHVFAAQAAQEAKNRADRGLALAQERKLSEAEIELRRAVQLEPNVAVYHAQLASIQGLEEKWDEAIQNFERAVELEPENLNFRREAAAVQWRRGQLRAAEANLRFVLEKRADDGGAILLLGLVNEARGNFADASRQLNSQFARAITDPELTVRLCNATLRSGQQENLTKIIAALQTRSAEPAWELVIANCSTIASNLGNAAAAGTLFSMIVSNSPARFDAGYNLAVLHYRSRRPEAAEKLLQDLFDAGWQNADGERLLAFCYLQQNQVELARSSMEKALRIHPSDVSLYADYIAMEAATGNMEKAAVLRDRLVGAAPQNPATWVVKGNAELRSGLNAEAIESYGHAEKLGGATPEALLGMADAYFLSGNREKALEQCRSAINKFPKDARGFVTYAKILLESPEPAVAMPEAERLLNKAAELEPNSSGAHYLLGQLALAQGKNARAEVELKRSVALDPSRSEAHFALSSLYRRLNRKDEAAREFAEFQRLKEIEERVGSVPPAERRE